VPFKCNLRHYSAEGKQGGGQGGGGGEAKDEYKKTPQEEIVLAKQKEVNRTNHQSICIDA
jgi:hypothetical protein